MTYITSENGANVYFPEGYYFTKRKRKLSIFLIAIVISSLALSFLQEYKCKIYTSRTMMCYLKKYIIKLGLS